LQCDDENDKELENTSNKKPKTDNAENESSDGSLSDSDAENDTGLLLICFYVCKM